MKKIVVITPPDAAHGFALAGLRQLTTSADEVWPIMQRLARDPLVGVAIVDERLVDATVRECMRELDRRWPGLVVVMPAPKRGERAEEDYVLQLIRRAIGYQVRLN